MYVNLSVKFCGPLCVKLIKRTKVIQSGEKIDLFISQFDRLAI